MIGILEDFRIGEKSIKVLNKKHMKNSDFYMLMSDLFEQCKKIAESKGKDYTVGSLDALANFKRGGESLGIPPEKVCWIFMNKHYQAITNYVKTGGQSESEPIRERIKDLINYLVLLQAIIVEGQETTASLVAQPDKEEEEKNKMPVDELF